MIKLKTLRGREYSGLSLLIIQGSFKEAGRSKVERNDARIEAEVREKKRCYTVGFQGEKGVKAEEYGQPLETGEGKEMDSP